MVPVVFSSLKTHALNMLFMPQKHRPWRYPAHEQVQLLILIRLETFRGSLVFMHPDYVRDASYMTEHVRRELQPLDEIDFGFSSLHNFSSSHCLEYKLVRSVFLVESVGCPGD